MTPEPEVTGTQSFTVTSSIALLTLDTELDYEVAQYYFLKMTLEDTGSGVTGDIHVRVRILNIGEAYGRYLLLACLDFREFVILGLLTKSRIRELYISMIKSAHNNNFCEIPKFAKIKTTRILTDLQYVSSSPASTKHLYNICTMLDQRRRRLADVVQMFYKFSVSA